MGQILHGCATTTEAVRRAIQNSQESLRVLAKRHGMNQKTVAKWKQRETVTDLPTGPKKVSSTVLSIEEEAIIVAFRRHTLLPLDDCLYALQPTIPHLTRSSLHRCLQRHGISRLPEVEGSRSAKKKFKPYTVGTWRNRFAERRMDGLYDEPRLGAPREIGDDEIAALVRKTSETRPQGATHWSLRTMGKEIGHAPSTVHRIWRAFGLQPHRVETFKLSSDPLFVEKVRDIVGLYLSPPERALVLCVDEKSQVQALDRTQPLLPMRPGQTERRTHDYTRHGTTSLFAALDVKAGTIIGKCMIRHRTQEFRKFLDEVERNVPADLDIHVVMDNYGTHKTQLIRNWFAKRPRWHVHYTPTSASWINQVERFFALLTERALSRGVFRSVAELEDAIKAYIAANNADPKPFRWTKTADDILASIKRFCLRTLGATA